MIGEVVNLTISYKNSYINKFFYMIAMFFILNTNHTNKLPVIVKLPNKFMGYSVWAKLLKVGHIPENDMGFCPIMGINTDVFNVLYA